MIFLFFLEIFFGCFGDFFLGFPKVCLRIHAFGFVFRFLRPHSYHLKKNKTQLSWYTLTKTSL